MNPNLKRLQPYPFEKLRILTSTVTPANISPIAWSVGEPKHKAPDFLREILIESIDGFSKYPSTTGSLELREAISDWCKRRFKLGDNSGFTADKNVLPVTGTREALFSIVQALFDNSVTNNEIWMPNPFYQIYEGATFLAGGEVKFLNCTAQNNYQPDFETYTDEQWAKCQMLFLCTPGNPSGSTLSSKQFQFVIQKSQQHNFIILSDECYSELYRDEENPPTCLLEASNEAKNTGFKNCLAFHSLSKRSNLPGLRSGFVAGDSDLLELFLQYRTYHGCAMPIPHQQVSIAAWNDEEHVLNNRKLYNEKFKEVFSELKGYMPLTIPEASFYLWPNLEQDDEAVTKRWLQEANIHVLPGQYLSRTIENVNPGYGHVRIALVATLDECMEAVSRLKKIL